MTDVEHRYKVLQRRIPQNIYDSRTSLKINEKSPSRRSVQNFVNKSIKPKLIFGSMRNRSYEGSMADWIRNARIK